MQNKNQNNHNTNHNTDNKANKTDKTIAVGQINITKEYVDNPYGEEVAIFLHPAHIKLLNIKDKFIESFYKSLAHFEGPAGVLSILTKEEFDDLKAGQGKYFEKMISPDLTLEEHKTMANSVGIIHACSGIDSDWLIESYDLYLDILQKDLIGSVRMRPALSVVSRRLSLDLRWQLDSYKQIEKERRDAFKKIDELVWKAENYSELIEDIVDILYKMQEVNGAVIGRFDGDNIYRAEALKGKPLEIYFNNLDKDIGVPVMGDSTRPEGQGKIGLALRTGEIQTVRNYKKDGNVSLWNDLYKSMNVKSAALVPLKIEGSVFAVLAIFCPFVNGFYSPDYNDFLSYLQHILSFGLERLQAAEGTPAVQSILQRLKYRNLLRDDGLVMYYQPVVDLKTGETVKVEALARLKDDNLIVSPGQFLPSFKSECLFELYRTGFKLMLEDYKFMLKEGIFIDISINLPSHGLIDKRYLEITKSLLENYQLFPYNQDIINSNSQTETNNNNNNNDSNSNKNINAGINNHTGNNNNSSNNNDGDNDNDNDNNQKIKHENILYLELLESDVLELEDMKDVEVKFNPWLNLGLRFAEDDLGAGYSSLLRLRQLPFEVVKIDQGLVREAYLDPLTVIELMSHLIDLSHALDKKVVVEGLESHGLIEAATILGADYGQGYAFSKPIPANEFINWFYDRKSNIANSKVEKNINENINNIKNKKNKNINTNVSGNVDRTNDIKYFDKNSKKNLQPNKNFKSDINDNINIKRSSITFMGALASLMHFEKKLKAVDGRLKVYIANNHCGLEEYINKNNSDAVISELKEAHEKFHKYAAEYDLQSDKYQKIRRYFIELLKKYLPE
jgi:EAL domain-containing protein (putative c-di-GMP-specific phosphodiesterase class I)/GAF domain-containing protein